jgi:adenylate cyclase
MLAGISALVFADVPAGRLAVVMICLTGSALLSGFLSNVGAARAVADPVNAVRRAMRRVQDGDLEASVPVYDGTELGRLQAGFNTMVNGLKEREPLRDPRTNAAAQNRETGPRRRVSVQM